MDANPPRYCPKCREAYGAGRPSHFGSDPQCAFPDGSFQSNNWNCITANAIRDHTFQDEDRSRAQWDDDQYAALLPWREHGWLLVSWYKHRGRTDRIFVFNGDEVRPITLAEAQEYLTDMVHE